MASWDLSRDRWIKHYASFHRILLVGEGDFSFALSLANCFGSAANIVATSLDSHDVLISKFKWAHCNLKQLQRFGAILIFRVDATNMMHYFAAHLANFRFDRIVFNFPHAGFHGREDNPQVIQRHRKLVEGFFRNAVEMLQPNGEVHVTHKTKMPFSEWNITELAFRNNLVLLDCVDFNRADYPGYYNKRGDSYWADEPFPVGESCTYKFVLNSSFHNTNHISTSAGLSYNQPRDGSSNLGWLIFYVSGWVSGESGLAGCGGVLIDHDGVRRIVFSAPLGVMPYEVAQLCAFKAALHRFLRSRFGNRFVLIRSNSYCTVSGINNRSLRPMHLWEHFNQIDSMLNASHGARVELIRIEDNQFAETCAKRAILYGAFEAAF